MTGVWTVQLQKGQRHATTPGSIGCSDMAQTSSASKMVFMGVWKAAHGAAALVRRGRIEEQIFNGYVGFLVPGAAQARKRKTRDKTASNAAKKTKKAATPTAQPTDEQS